MTIELWSLYNYIGIFGLFRLAIIDRLGVTLLIMIIVLSLCVFEVIVRVTVMLSVLSCSDVRLMAVLAQPWFTLLWIVVFRVVLTCFWVVCVRASSPLLLGST